MNQGGTGISSNNNHHIDLFMNLLSSSLFNPVKYSYNGYKSSYMVMKAILFGAAKCTNEWNSGTISAKQYFIIWINVICSLPRLKDVSVQSLKMYGLEYCVLKLYEFLKKIPLFSVSSVVDQSLSSSRFQFAINASRFYRKCSFPYHLSAIIVSSAYHLAWFFYSIIHFKCMNKRIPDENEDEKQFYETNQAKTFETYFSRFKQAILIPLITSGVVWLLNPVGKFFSVLFNPSLFPDICTFRPEEQFDVLFILDVCLKTNGNMQIFDNPK